MTSHHPDAPALLGEELLGDALPTLVEVVRPRGVVDGWGTVELDRAEVELSVAPAGERGEERDPGSVGLVVEAAPPDRILGAACRLLRRPAGAAVLLLEPSIDRRLAGALARHGEGYIVRYLLADSGAPERVRRAGFEVSAEAAGPLGPERLVLTGPRDGPFVILAGLD